MIYKITFSCDEIEKFRRTFEADSEATFLDLHKAILASTGFPDDQMTSFYMCNERWEKGQEVTLIEMGNNFEYDNMTMEETRLSDLLTETGDRLIYVFDPLFERCFFGVLKEILSGSVDGVECTERVGKAPKQLESEENMNAILGKDGKGDLDLDDTFNDNQIDLDDLDAEGFQDLSFEDGTMF